jgi:5-methylcytosine-specific restriction endonuclease McrA
MNKQDKLIYQQIVEEQPYCQLCGSTEWLEIHHIIYKSQLGKTTKDNLIRLCKKCHMKCHSNKRVWQPILIERIKKDD